MEAAHEARLISRTCSRKFVVLGAVCFFQICLLTDGDVQSADMEASLVAFPPHLIYYAGQPWRLSITCGYEVWNLGKASRPPEYDSSRNEQNPASRLITVPHADM